MRLFVAIVTLVIIVGGTVACATQMVDDKQRQGRTTVTPIDAVLKRHTDRLMSLPGVVGTAIGACEKNPCIKVLVVKTSPALVKQIPPMLEGYPVVIEETGEIRILNPH